MEKVIKTALLSQCSINIQRMTGKNKIFENQSNRFQKLSSEQIHLLEQLIKEIEQRIEDPSLSVDKLSQKFYTSPRNLLRKVKNTTGMTIVKLRTVIKMRHAAILLHQNNMAISEVAYSIGYNDPIHFSKSFKKFYGVSPKLYRELINSENTKNNLS